jgi:Kdo2-lipid IVA lauroyltransferase/acyltransferase
MEKENLSANGRIADSLPWSVEKTREYLRTKAMPIDTRGHRGSKFLIAVLVFCIRKLSWEGADRLGTWIGRLLYRLRIRRDIAMTNLDIAFGDRKNPEEKEAIYKESLLNFARHMLNYLRAPLMDEKFWSAFEVENEALIHELFRRKKGVILIGAHVGEWEIGSARVGMMGYPGSMIAKRIGHPVIEKFLIDARLDMNLGTVFSSGSMDQILESVRRGEVISMAIDQNIRYGRGVFVEWMGRPASTIRSSAWVARETGAPVFAGFACRVGPGRYRAVVTEEIPWEPHPEDPDKELLINTRNHARAQEKIIYEHPELWLWIHRRWRVQPKGVPDPYRKPDSTRGKRDGFRFRIRRKREEK